MKLNVLIFSQEKKAEFVYSSLGRPQILHAKIDDCFLCPLLLPVIPLSAYAPVIFLPLTMHTYLTASKRQHFLSTSCFSSPPLVVFSFFFLKANTAASVERRTNPIPRSRPGFSPVFARQKTQLSLHMNLRRSVAAIVKERSVTIYSGTEI